MDTKDKAQQHLYQGASFIKQEKLDDAIEELNKAIDLDKQSLWAHGARGLAHFKKGALKQAVADYSKAIEINPKFIWAYKNRGVAFKALGDHESAKNDLDKAKRLRTVVEDILGLEQLTPKTRLKKSKLESANEAFHRIVDKPKKDPFKSLKEERLCAKARKIVEARERAEDRERRNIQTTEARRMRYNWKNYYPREQPGK